MSVSAQEAAGGEAGDPGKALVESQHHALLRQTSRHHLALGPPGRYLSCSHRQGMESKSLRQKLRSEV